MLAPSKGGRGKILKLFVGLLVGFLALSNFPAFVATAPQNLADSTYTSIPLDSTYKLWVDGPLHSTRIYYQSNSLQSKPRTITSEAYTPISVIYTGDGNMLHVVWEDATSRLISCYYIKSGDGGASWSSAIKIPGKCPALAVNKDNIYIVTRHNNKLILSKSSDGGRTFSQQTLTESTACSIPSIAVAEGYIHVGWYGGVRDEATGTRSDKGIYYRRSLDGKRWSKELKLVACSSPVKSLAINLDKGLAIEWCEDLPKEEITYSISSKDLDLSWSRPFLTSKATKASPDLNPNFVASSRAAKVEKEWTFIVYLDADNNLYNYGKEDLNEMEMIGSNADINIVVLMDLNTNGDTKAYYVEHDTDTGTITSPQIPLTNINASWGNELNMGDPQTAIDFAKYVYDNYPAKKYLMDFWNHGGSWKYGMCSDDTNSDDFTMQEVRTIFETLRAQTGRRILWDVCGYDECLMSDVSVDYDEKPYINYILNSEDSIGGDGWEYNIVLGHLNDSPAMDAETFAYWVYWSYGERYGWSGSLTTMSVINCTEFDYVLMPAINNLGQKLRHRALTLNSNIKTAASNSQSWQEYTHQRDLIDFAQNLQSQIPAATDQEIYDAAQLVIDLGAANAFGDVPWNATWNHSKAILCHNKNTGENGITIYCTETTYDTTYDTLRIAPETSWDDAVKAVIANTTNYPDEEPHCTITSPSEGGYCVINTIVKINGTANDSTDGGIVSKVEVKIDREAWQLASGTTSWTTDWDTTGWTPGPHKIFARAYDGTDYSQTWACVNVELIVDPTLPDLTLSASDIIFNNTSPNEGDLVKINATVYNVNPRPDAQNATGVEIGFYDGNPSAGGVLIGIVPATPSLIEPGKSGWGAVTWNTSMLAGWHDIYVVADPNHTVPELTEGNNTASKSIAVAGYAVSVACTDNSSTIQAGASTTYEIVVRNCGTYTDSFELTIDNPTAWNANFNDNPPPGAKAAGTLKTKAEYNNYTTATNKLQSIEAAPPDITKLYSIGKSWENRDIWAMKVSDNVAVNETDEPDVLYMGMHHAREWMSVEVPLYFLDYLVNNYGTDPKVTYLVDNRELWIVPMMNPDGYQYSREVDSNWRKNRRDNGDGTYGVDLNRNYNGSQNGDPDGAWGGAGASTTTSAENYCGPSPFSEPENQAIRDLVIEHASSGNKFVLSVSYHSYAEEIYYPWGYARSAGTPPVVITPDASLQRRIAENLSVYNGYTVMQSGDAYLTTGDSDDWIYGYSKYILGDPTYPFTIELDTVHQPPTSQIPITCEKNLGVNLYLAEIADNPAQEYPVITHTPLPNTKNTTGPYRAVATITSAVGLNTSTLKLVWKTSAVPETTVALTPTGSPNEYYADIPGQENGTNVFYYIYAEDLGGNRSTSPETKPWESQNYYKFYVGTDRLNYTIYNLAANATRAINLTVTSPETALPEEVAKIKVIATSQNNSLKTSSVETLTIIIPGILLADDTNGGDISGFKAALDAGGYKYDVKIAEGSTGFSGVLSQYPIVIWVCKGTNTISDVDNQNLRFYLLEGGNLFISGEDIGYDIGTSGVGESGFLADWLHADYIADNSGIKNLDGVTNDPIGDGFTNINITGSYPSEIAPYDANASIVFNYTGSTKNAVIKADTGTYRVVYFACMYFEGPDLAANKTTIMDRIIKWLRGAPKIIHTKLKDTEDTTGPYKVIATITDNNLNLSALEVRYSTNEGVSYTTLKMSETGSANEYYADIPGQAAGTTVYYYIRASDLDGNLGLSPANANESAPSSLYSFWVGPDTTPPTIMHTPLSNTSGSSPYAVTATITDNLALNISALFVYYNTSKSPGYIQLAMSSVGGNDYSASIPSQTLGTTINYYIEATDAANIPNTATHPAAGRHSFTIVLMPSILLIDDDGTDTWETYYQNALTGSGYEYTMGTGASSLSGYDIVIWFADDTSFLSTDEETKLRAYLDSGGCVFMSAEEFGYSHNATALYTSYFNLSYSGDNAGAGAQTVVGVSGDPITDGMSIAIGGSGGAANNNYPDYFTTAKGTIIFTLGSYNVGMRYDSGTYKVVYTGFNFESINSASDRAALIDKIIKWFNPTYANDTGVWSIDSPQADCTYNVSELQINATVLNYGTSAQSNFEVRCEVKEIEPGYPSIIFEDRVEAGAGDWLHEDLSGGGDLWHINSTYGYGSTSSWFCGNDGANYNANMNNTLTSPSIDLTGRSGNIIFSFWTDYDLEGSTYDNLYVEVYDGTWAELEHYPQATGDVSGGWVYKEYNISAYAGKIIQVRFRLKTDGTINYGGGVSDPPEGVFIDDILIREAVFEDNTESGAGSWTHSALGGTAYDLWHIVDYYGHINGTSWFCGNDNANYNNSMDNALSSQNIVLPVTTGKLLFSFWTDYDLEGSTYDNLYVEIYDGAWIELEHYPQATGDVSGGWVYKEYDISSYAGKTIKIRFRLVTDGSVPYGGDASDPPEGVFIDDITIREVVEQIETVVFSNSQSVPATLNQYDTYSATWSYKFDNISRYKITIRTNLAGDEKASNDEKTILINTTYRLELTPGWNLITLPYIDEGYTAEALAIDIDIGGTKVAKWDTINGSFVIHEKGSALNNFKLKPGIGYNVFVSSDVTFELKGAKVAKVVTELAQGWNSIGWLNDTKIKASELAAKIGNCNAVAYWNEALGRFVVHVVGTSLSDFTIEKDRGYFVYVTEATIWVNE